MNKQLKSSESNNYTRATAVDLKTIDSEVAKLSGRATQTPIGMKELWDEVQKLKATNSKVKYINGTYSNPQTLLNEISNRDSVYAYFKINFKIEGNKEIICYGKTGNFSLTQKANGTFGSESYRAYATLEKSNNNISLKVYAIMGDYGLSIQGFLIY